MIIKVPNKKGDKYRIAWQDRDSGGGLEKSEDEIFS